MDWGALITSMGKAAAPWLLFVAPTISLVVWLIRWIIKRTAAEVEAVRKDRDDRLAVADRYIAEVWAIVRGYQDASTQQAAQMSAMLEGQRTLQKIMEGVAEVLRREGDR